MVFAHCIQFFGDLGKNQIAYHISEYINLTTFSGFLFCFGYVSDLAYFGKEWRGCAGKILKNALRLLVCFYISSFCFGIFVENIPLDREAVLEIFMLKRLAGYSEFLFSFALIMVLECILFPFFSRKWKWGGVFIIAMVAISILTCFLPHREVGSIIGSLIGGVGGAYFPVIPYGIYFLAGIWFSRRQEKSKIIFSLACGGTIWHSIDYVLISGGQPSRFPLSFSFLVGATLFIYLYYMLAKSLEEKANTLLGNYLECVGKNSLLYLLLSNFIIFSVTATQFYRKGLNYSIGMFFIILFVVWYLQRLCKVRK